MSEKVAIAPEQREAADIAAVMAMLEVRRGGDHILVGGRFFLLRDLLEAVEVKLRAVGLKSLSGQRPPFFYTGSPYAEAIINLGVSEVGRPQCFQVEYVPHHPHGGMPWFGSHRIWPDVFNVRAIAERVGDAERPEGAS